MAALPEFDDLLRRQMLYPAELRAHGHIVNAWRHRRLKNCRVIAEQTADDYNPLLPRNALPSRSVRLQIQLTFVAG